MEKAKGKRRLGGKDGGICPRRRPPFGAPSPQQRKMGAGEIQIPHGEPVEPRDLDFAFSSVGAPPTSSFDRLILRQAQDEVGGGAAPQSPPFDRSTGSRPLEPSAHALRPLDASTSSELAAQGDGY